jgi:hypothetical protein
MLLDFGTDWNGAVYYSGKENYKAAKRYARCTGKKMIFDTQGGEFLDRLTSIWEMQENLSREEVLDLWRAASSKFAIHTVGTATAFVDPSGGHDIEFSVYLQIEKPILDRHPLVFGTNEYPPDYDECEKRCRGN